MIKLTLSKNSKKIYINPILISSFKWLDEYNSTVINMQHAPSVWVYETPEYILEALQEWNKAVNG